MRAITLEEAVGIIDGAIERAIETACKPLSIIVLDAGGQIKAFKNQDHTANARFEIAYGKANVSLLLGRSSKLALRKYKEKPQFMECLTSLNKGPIFLEGGGQLIRDNDGEVIGAIGITGDVNEKDDDCAIFGIHSRGLKADSDFDWTKK